MQIEPFFCEYSAAKYSFFESLLDASEELLETHVAMKLLQASKSKRYY